MNEAQPTDSVTCPTSVMSKEVSDFLIAEYSALREELLKRIEIQHQLISLVLIAAGTFISIGLQGSTTILLAYPILAMFLAAAWAQNDIKARQIGVYIRDCIESKFLDSKSGWEHLYKLGRTSRLGSFSLLASRGVIVGTQLLAILLSLLKTQFPIEDIFLFILNGLVIVFTVFLLQRHRINEEAFKIENQHIEGHRKHK